MLLVVVGGVAVGVVQEALDAADARLQGSTPTAGGAATRAGQAAASTPPKACAVCEWHPAFDAPAATGDAPAPGTSAAASSAAAGAAAAATSGGGSAGAGSSARPAVAAAVAEAVGPAAPKLRLCERCRAVRYCCAECQRADWHAGHKALCKPASAHGAGSGADPS